MANPADEAMNIDPVFESPSGFDGRLRARWELERARWWERSK
jgi:hypothetical protein